MRLQCCAVASWMLVSVVVAEPGKVAQETAPHVVLPEKVQVTGIKAVYRNGQTFVTWKDAADGAAGALLRYSLYRSDQPITPENLAGPNSAMRACSITPPSCSARPLPR